ncbi:hypothetical protein OHA44_37185 [Streptomyces sp. NBC_00144]|uniref:hypothetical protein n=1 Tax=Streptomyces sp. NBC_00144 TaxID=2975665 RepID=UPI0032448316
MTLASVAVIVFFRRTHHDTRVWHTIVAPALAVVGLGTVLVLVIGNFTQVIPDPTSAWVVGLLVVLCYAVGVGIAVGMRRRRPAVYERLADE